MIGLPQALRGAAWPGSRNPFSVTVPPSAPTNGTADRHTAVRRVVAQRDFEVVFQPVHDVHTAMVVGLEALARFPCEPFRPDAFLAQAASLGLGIELETAILEVVGNIDDARERG